MSVSPWDESDLTWEEAAADLGIPDDDDSIDLGPAPDAAPLDEWQQTDLAHLLDLAAWHVGLARTALAAARAMTARTALPLAV